MKTIVRPCFRAFFNGRPSLALPAADGLFVAFAGSADGPLRAPVERPQDLPDMALVIAHAELVGDQTSHPRTAPQRRREAVRFGAFEQHRLQAFQLHGVQPRLTAGAAGLAQPGFAVTPVSSQPLADALPRDLQSPRCLGLTTALLDQPDRFETALLQGLEIPPYAFCVSHTYKDVRTPKKVSLYFARLNKYSDHVKRHLSATLLRKLRSAIAEETTANQSRIATGCGHSRMALCSQTKFFMRSWH